MFIDVNEFKQINDSFGHAAGDAVLVGVATRIRAGLREGDLAARIGGDEFAVLLAHINAANDPGQVVERLHASLKDPLTAPDAGRLEVSISVGVALYPDDADTATGLLRAADTAMYNVKRSRGTGHAPHAGEHAPADY
jgi:diguanylate cyclase (GGDEF)-like protein